MFSTYVIVSSVLAAYAVFAAPQTEPMFVVSEDLNIMRGTDVDGAKLMALPGDGGDGRLASIQFVMALQRSSIWSEVRKKSLTLVTGLDKIVDRSPDTLSDSELAMLKRACQDGLKCVAVEELIFLQTSEEPTGDGRTAVLTAMTKITKVISEFTSEYHEDRFQYKEIKDSDDPSTVFETVTTIVQDNMEMCRIGGAPGVGGQASAYYDDSVVFPAEREVSYQKQSPVSGKNGGDSGDIQVVNHANLNLGTVNNFNLNLGTINAANVNTGIPNAGSVLSVGKPDDDEEQKSPETAPTANDDVDLHLILVLDSPEDGAENESKTRCRCGNRCPLAAIPGPGPRFPGTDNNAVADVDNRQSRGIISAAPKTVDYSPVPARDPRNFTKFEENSEVDFDTKGNFNRGDVKKGYVMNGNLTNGATKTVNVNRGVINKDVSGNKSNDGPVSVGTINAGPVNYGTINKYFNSGTQNSLSIDDFQKYLAQIENVYSSMYGSLKP